MTVYSSLRMYIFIIKKYITVLNQILTFSSTAEVPPLISGYSAERRGNVLRRSHTAAIKLQKRLK